MAVLTKEYQDWSVRARIRQVETGVGNKELAEELGYSRQFVTAVVNGRKETPLAIHRISIQLGIGKPGYSGQ